MNNSTKLENITAYAKEHDIDYIHSKYILYGRKDATAIDSFLLGAFGALTMKQYIIIFGKDHLTLILLSMTGDLKEKIKVISYKDIVDISFKKGGLASTFVFSTKEEKHKIKCNNKVIGMHWQNENLKNCLEHPIMVKYVS